MSHFAGFTTCSRLPFCKPVSVVKSVENLGEILVSRLHGLTTAQQTSPKKTPLWTRNAATHTFLCLFLDVLFCLEWICSSEAGDVIENSPYDLRMGQKLMDDGILRISLSFAENLVLQRFFLRKLSEVTINSASCCVSRS